MTRKAGSSQGMPGGAYIGPERKRPPGLKNNILGVFAVKLSAKKNEKRIFLDTLKLPHKRDFSPQSASKVHIMPKITLFGPKPKVTTKF